MIINIKTKQDMDGITVSDNVISWEDFMNINSRKISDIDLINKDDLALIIHSSGTTSLPKGILLTNSNVNALPFQYKLTSLRTDPGSRFLSVIPAFASFGMVASINLPLVLSMENYLLPIVSPKAFADHLVRDKINFTLTIPANFKYVSRKKNIKNLTSLYGPGCGGYSLNSAEEAEIQDGLLKKKAPVPMLMGWGMSELSSTASLETPECSKLLSLGIPLVKNTISIFKLGTDIECGYDEEGEICVNGPTIMKGYFNNPEKTLKTIKKHSDGKYWLHSGDLGKMDSDGRLTPVGRSERIIIKGKDGFKIFPQKIEEVISTSDYVDIALLLEIMIQRLELFQLLILLLRILQIKKWQLMM